MSERPVNCFRCGGDGHYARNCPQCTYINTQPTIPATIVHNLDTSPEIALKNSNKLPREEEKEEKEGTEEIEEMKDVPKPSATAVEDTDIWQETALQVRI